MLIEYLIGNVVTWINTGLQLFPRRSLIKGNMSAYIGDFP